MAQVGNEPQSEKETLGKQVSDSKVRYLSGAEAAAIEQELINEYKFSKMQLTALGGLSVATAVSRTFPSVVFKDALVICGSGMIGSYGLVAAVQLMHYGYNVTVHYAKHTQEPAYLDLLTFCTKMGVNMAKRVPPAEKMRHNFKVIVDALYEYEYAPVLDAIINSKVPVCSIDVPSGWNIDTGPKSKDSLKPAMLISIGAPKKCAHPDFLHDAHHFLGGRFIARGMIEKHQLVIPNYPVDDQIVDMRCFGPCCKQ